VVVGVGINYFVPPEAFPAELRDRAGSLYPMPGKMHSRDTIMREVCGRLADAFSRVQEGGISKVLREWNAMNWFVHRKVLVSGPLGAVEGDGLFLDGRRVLFHVFKDGGVVPMPLSSSVEARS
jgi:biotin-(acetyl-CoA carboxylase) ligase